MVHELKTKIQSKLLMAVAVAAFWLAAVAQMPIKHVHIMEQAMGEVQVEGIPGWMQVIMAMVQFFLKSSKPRLIRAPHLMVIQVSAYQKTQSPQLTTQPSGKNFLCHSSQYFNHKSGRYNYAITSTSATISTTTPTVGPANKIKTQLDIFVMEK